MRNSFAGSRRGMDWFGLLWVGAVLLLALEVVSALLSANGSAAFRLPENAGIVDVLQANLHKWTPGFVAEGGGELLASPVFCVALLLAILRLFSRRN